MENGARTRRPPDSNNNSKIIPKMTTTTIIPTTKKTPAPALRKVQIVYYLSRNGQLEQPHFMELSHLAHHPLRLKDVMERLMLLRGKGMPSQYSWSCKRSYKKGYVWNDLSENDVVYPTESQSSEYILKGSEIQLLLQQTSGSASEKTQQHDVSFRSVAACPKRATQHTKRHPEPQEVLLYGEEEEENYDDGNYEEKGEDDNNNDDKEMEDVTLKQTTTELTHRNSVADPNPRIVHSVATESLLGRNSLLLQLIACGGGGTAATNRRITSSSPTLYKGVVCNRAAAAAAATELEEEMIIRCMSENPRFGNLQAEEKEYFSGSIVDSMISSEERVRSVESAQLKKSSSYNEERSLKIGLGEAEEELQKEHGADDIKKREKSRCIPMRKMRSSCITRQPNNNNNK